MKKTLFVFDIDGTLTDSVKQHQSAFYQAMKEIGLKDIDTNWSSYLHHTDHYIFQQNFERYFRKALKPLDLLRFEDLVAEDLSRQSQISEINGASSFLQNLINQGHSYCLATGSLRKPAIVKMRQAKIPFNEYLLATASENMKREDIVLSAISKAKRFYKEDSFQNTISLGDGLWDLKTANNLNISFIAIGGKSKKLLEQGAKNHYTDFTNLKVN
jgi:beta-phosphoglucomutase-like phosphatase (HAD superfamily)